MTKAQLMHNSEQKSEQLMVLGLKKNSNTYLIYQFLREKKNEKFTPPTIAKELPINYNTIYSSLRRLVEKGLILKISYGNFSEYFYPTSSLEAEKLVWDLTKGLKYNKMHNIRLFHQAKHKITIYGVEQTLGGRKGEREWKFGKDSHGHVISRTIKWTLGYNKNKSRPPSIQITMACSDRPLSIPDDWVAFLIYLDGMLNLGLADIANANQWKLMSAHFHNDYILGPEMTTLDKPVEIKNFTDAISRLYDKEIDGLWYRRDEKCFAEDANYAPSLPDWMVQQEAGVTPYAAENLVVGALNTISQESRATRVSQRRLEKSMVEQQKVMAEQQQQTNAILKDLASVMKELKGGPTK